HYERLVQLSGPQPSFVFGLARSHLGLGNSSRAEGLLARIAPDDGSGYPPAHFDRAMGILASTKLPTPVELSRVERHLKLAENSQASDVLLGQLYMQAGRPAQAREYLERAVSNQPRLLHLLM